MKNGAPNAAIKTPAGTSFGKKIVRPTKSASKIEAAPQIADITKRFK